MKTISSHKSNKSDSQKTPGGISKSLLTPCRRVGLSRNWKRQGPSPFISPLSGNGEATSIKDEKVETRKRKERIVDEVSVSPECSGSVNLGDVHKTPSREVGVPRKKRSKTLLSVINKSQEDINIEAEPSDKVKDCVNFKNEVGNVIERELEQDSTTEHSQSKKSLLKAIDVNENNNPLSQVCNEIDIKENLTENITSSIPDFTRKEKPVTQQRVPNDLAKECIVVLQKKIFKKDPNKPPDGNLTTIELKEEKQNSQYLFDSDSDNEPLINKNKCKSKPNSDDEDFLPSNKNKNKLKIDKKKKATPMPNTKSDRSQKVNGNVIDHKPSSQSSFDDDDDFEFEKKRTIVIRKTYDKVKKPVKAKSTGSITQKDIEDLKARIEAKKKLLLAKSMTEDTKELRDLIKKWQKGCQDALMQLMDLMNSKLTDQKNMNYSEMLEMLKIPTNLVGYDEENDCFKTPDDTNIILSNI